MGLPDVDDFPDPVTERLTLRDGHFVDIKRELTIGEWDDMMAVIQPYGIQDRRVVRTAQIDAYLIGWSLTKQGRPVPMMPATPAFTATDRLNTIRGLRVARAAEIFRAIVAHEAEVMAAQVEAQKKILSGTSGDGITSPSPSGPAGSSPSATSVASAAETSPSSATSSSRPRPRAAAPRR